LKILMRALLTLEQVKVRISRMDGGNKSNAIPREAEALVFLPAKKVAQAGEVLAKFEATVKAEMQTVEPDLAVVLEPVKGKKKATVVKRSLQKKILSALSAMPHGVTKMSADIPGLVETSTNLAIIKTTSKKITVITSQRSPVASELDEIHHTVCCVFELAGAEIVSSGGYPGWKPNMDSPILKVAKSTYKKLTGREPHVKAVHAGLECGIIGERYPGMDMVSFGPTLECVHSPDERIYIDTVPKFYDFLSAILRNV